MDPETANTEEVELTQDNRKRKRTMSEKQLKALEEGRKKRWLSKQTVKEEQTATTSEEDTTDQSTSETDQSKTETETDTTEGEPSTADESAESSATNTNSDKTEDSDSSEEEEDDEDEDEEDEEKDDSEDSEPPSPPVLRRQKATLNEHKNKRATSKMMRYLQAKTNPYFTHMYV